MEQLKIRKPKDRHLHLRRGAMLHAVLPYTTAWCSSAIIMPNCKPEIFTSADARAYKKEILKARDTLDPESTFEPKMTLYLTPITNPDDVVRGFEEGDIVAVKRYPHGATTNSNAGVTGIEESHALFKVMERNQIPLLCHGEVTHDEYGEEVDDFDRSKLFVRDILPRILLEYPDLPVCLEHISCEEDVEVVTRWGCDRFFATIAPQYLAYDRQDRFRNGNAADLTCRPFLKRKRHKEALRTLVQSRSSYIMLGTDSAPHPYGAKAHPTECACGAFNAPTALSIYAHVFEELGVLDYLEAFASLNGDHFYNENASADTVTLVKKPLTTPGPVAIDEHTTVWPMGYREDTSKNTVLSWSIA